ncbi:MAG: DUF3347 domain-containing protein [Bacteroidota bacterium]
MKVNWKGALWALAFGMIISACGSSQSGEAQNEESRMDQIVEAYLSLKDAFVASDPDEAQEKAETLMASLAEVEGMSGVEKEAHAIHNSQDIEEQREHFESLSESVYQAVSEADGLNKTLYRQYCPMAFDNKGAFWISDSDKVRNPYFGDAMLKCGSVKEVIE